MSFLLDIKSLQGQDFKLDIKNNLVFYENSLHLNIQYSISVYDNEQINPHYSLDMNIKKNANNYLLALPGSNIFLCKSSMIMVNNRDRKIVYNPHSEAEFKASLNKLTSLNIEDILSTNDSVIFIGYRQGSKVYSIYSSKLSIKHTQIYLDSTTNRFARIEYDYPKQKGKKSKAIIEFNYLPTTDLFFNNGFYEQNYVRLSEKKLKVSPTFKGYELVVVKD